LFEATMQHRVSQQTLLCFNLLTSATVIRRAEYGGAFSVLLENGIGGKAARLALPFTLTLPFVLAVARVLLVDTKMLYPGYATASTTSMTSLLAFWLILALARRIKALEGEVRELSLRDELTQLYNRRGFYVLAGQLLLLARRAEEPFSVLFLDIDNLKPTNDTLGHEAGSALLREMAGILRSSVREADVVGRLGGDEFVVAGRMSEAEIGVLAQRLEETAAEANARGRRKYSLRFSLGFVTAEAGSPQGLGELLEVADQMMFEQKREKKLLAPREVGRLPAMRGRW